MRILQHIQEAVSVDLRKAEIDDDTRALNVKLRKALLDSYIAIAHGLHDLRFREDVN